MAEERRTAAEIGADARGLVRAGARAALSSLLVGDGARPYGSLVLAAATQEGTPLLLMSDLAEHVKNIRADPRVSLLFDGTGGLEDPLEGARVSVQGRAVEDGDPLHRERFLRRHPKARAYAGFGDFRFYRVEADSGHLVAGFGRIHWIAPGDLLVPPAPALAEAEGELVDAANGGARAGRLGAALGGDGAGAWRVTGIDPEGVDLRLGARTGRLAFPARADTPEDAERLLAGLAAGA